MEKVHKKSKSKTPIRPYLNLAPEEIKDLRENLSKLGNSSEGLTERTQLTESPEKGIILDESVSLDENSLTILRYELEAKTNIITSLASNQKDLRQTITTLKAQNSSLHKELNSCRAKNYDLDVELYLAKEELCAKDKELEKIRDDLDSLQALVKNAKSLKEENLTLREDIQSMKVKFERKLSKEKEKFQELFKLVKDKQFNLLEDFKKRAESEDFTKKNSQSVERGFKVDPIRISRNYQPSLSPEKPLNQTDRPGKVSGSLLNDLMMILSVDQPHKVLSSVVHLTEYTKSLKKYKRFCKQLSDLVIECSPACAFYSKPNLKQVWVWITRLLEEYMKIKKNNDL
jgi:hypothetical protein